MKKYLSIIFLLFLFNFSYCQFQKGIDIDGENAGDYSGSAVSMPDINTVAIGAYNNSANGPSSGHVRVFRWNGNSWTQKGQDIDGEAAMDVSGSSVNMSDSNTVAIGAYLNDGNGTSSGHVRIFRWNGNSWTQKGQDIDGDANGDWSGKGISFPDSNTIAVGAYANDGNGFDAGQVRIFRWNGNSWTQKGQDIYGESIQDISGYSVSMPDTNTIAIGGHWNDGNGADAGHVRIYTWDGTSWIQKGIDIDGENAGDYSGHAVSMPDSNTVAVGAYKNYGNGTEAGHVRVFRWDGNSWFQKGVDIDGENTWDYSGNSVSMPDSNTVAIGAHGNDGNGFSSGHARIYTWNGNSWSQRGFDINGENSGDRSGHAVSMPDANNIAIGAYLNDGNGTSSGHTRIYSFCYNSSSNDTLIACDSLTWIDGNTYFNNNSTATHIIPNAASCDSVITLHLTILNTGNSTDTRLECSPYTWINGITYTSNNTTATHTIVNGGVNGCDSIITLNLTLNFVDDSVINNSPFFSAYANGATYQWLDCNNNYSILPGETNQTYTATSNGSYAIQISQNGCTDTSSCELVNNVSMDNNLSNHNFKLYPNPTYGNLIIEFGNNNNRKLILRNTLGEILSTKELTNLTKMELVLPEHKGVYFVEIISQSTRFNIIKIIKLKN